MSRAFTKEDSGHWGDPGRRYATGYYWGEPRLRDHVRHILERARLSGDERLEQLAQRFLR